MRWKSSNGVDDRAAFAWLAAFLATLALAAILAFAASAQAVTPTATSNPSAAAETPAEDPFGDDEFEAEEGAGGEVEDEECELFDAACEATMPTEVHEECLLNSVSATVSASLIHAKLRLTVRYTAFVPTNVTVNFWLRGSRGPLSLGETRKHFALAGVFRRTQSLTEAQRVKASAARSFTVQVRPVEAPQHCRNFFTRYLTVKDAVSGGFAWLDPEASPRRSPRS